MLSITQLWKSFGTTDLITHFSLSLSVGKMIAITGPNGCGKTTLFNIITGAETRDKGEITFYGEDITCLAPHQIARKGIIRKHQFPTLYPELTVVQHLELSLNRYGVKRREVDRWCAYLAEDMHADTVASDLAFGQQQWLEIAMVMALSPKLILLDEPTIGLNNPEKLCQWLRQHQKNQGSGMIISHDHDFLQRLECDIYPFALPC